MGEVDFEILRNEILSDRKQIREITEEIEEKTLSTIATQSTKSRGRQREEEPCPIRTCFQVDRDRILHSKAFRRLKRKTQVMLAPAGDHYRTRLTHTLEVMQIARTIARALRLNEDLTEAIALGHDLGHTPFGHAGEFVLQKIWSEDFHHAKQSLRVVDRIERDGKGLNLTWEVRDGILKHSKGMGEIMPKNPDWVPATAEGKVVRLSDIIAYLNHDLDDAIRAGIISIKDVPAEIREVIGEKYGERIERMVRGVIIPSLEAGEITVDPVIYDAMVKLRKFLYENVYTSEPVQKEIKKAERIIVDLFEYYLKHPDEFERDSGGFLPDEPFERRVVDFIAGMTDNFAINLWKEKFLPREFPYSVK